MDDASRAAVRLSIEAGLLEARRELQRGEDRLTEARARLEVVTLAGARLQTDRVRWEENLRTRNGHILSAGALRDFHREGEAIEERAEALVRSRASAEVAIMRSERRVEEGRRIVGEALARQRWIDEDARRGLEASERRAAQREDED